MRLKAAGVGQMSEAGPRARVIQRKTGTAVGFEISVAHSDTAVSMAGDGWGPRSGAAGGGFMGRPVPGAVARHIRADLDADEWRIGEMKEPRLRQLPVATCYQMEKPLALAGPGAASSLDGVSSRWPLPT
jgi:hypothetical protein